MKWLEKNTESLKGKTVAISGATGGIGKELVFLLGFLGADLILLDRNSEKSENLRKAVLEKFDIKVSSIILDLEQMETVKKAADKLLKLPVDYLVLNAGAYAIERKKCSTGFDNVFQINFVSPYYLARKLKPLIEERGGRVIAVSSIAHNYSKIDEKDIDFSGYKAASKAYGNAKRFLMFSLLGLFKGSENLAVTHPGITFTNITAHYPKLVFAIIKHPMKIIFMKPKTAALSILKGIFEPCYENEWIGPGIFNIWGNPRKQILKTCKETEARKICKITEEIYNKLT